MCVAKRMYDKSVVCRISYTKKAFSVKFCVFSSKFIALLFRDGIHRDNHVHNKQLGIWFKSADENK